MMPEVDWLARQVEISASRLAATDPDLLSPAGRELQAIAAELLGKRPPLRLIQGGAQ